MPYKDIFDHKGPLIYIYNWLGIQIEYYRGVWIIEVLSMFVSFYVIYLTARLFCNKASSLAVLFISVTPLFTYFGSGGGNMTEEYAIPFIAIALFIFIDFFIFGNITKIRLLLCGFCFGAVLLLRPNMIAVWIVFCIAVLIKTITCRDYKSLLNYLLFFIIGAGIILIPVSLWLMMNGAFDDMIQAYIIFNIEYVSSEVRATWEDRYVSFMKFFNTTFYMAAFITALFLAKKRKDLFHFSYVAYLILSLLLICMSGMTYNHYGMILVPAEVYSFSMIMSKIESIKKEKWLGMAFVGLFMIENVLPSWISLSSTAVGYIENMGVTERTDKVGQTVEVVEQYTDEDDLITVFGNWNIIYVLTERLSASKYSYQSPLIKIDTDMADEYFEDLENNNPSLIIMGTSFVEGDDAYGRMMDFIEEYNYELLTDEIKDTTIYIQSD